MQLQCFIRDAAWHCAVRALLSDRLSLCTCASFGHAIAKYRHANLSENRGRMVCAHICAMHNNTAPCPTQRHRLTQPSLSLGKAGMQQSGRERGRGQRSCERQERRGGRRKEQTEEIKEDETEQRRGKEREDIKAKTTK